MTNEKKEFWVRTKDSEYAILVKCFESDFDKTGLIKFERINKEGKSGTVFIKQEMIVSVNQVEEEKQED